MKLPRGERERERERVHLNFLTTSKVSKNLTSTFTPAVQPGRTSQFHNLTKT